MRHSEGVWARAAADVAADALCLLAAYLRRVLSGFEPDIAVVVAAGHRGDVGRSRNLLGHNGGGHPGRAAARVRDASFDYPDGAGGVDLQPFFDLVTIHELGHAFEVLGEISDVASSCRPSGWARSSPTSPSTPSSRRADRPMSPLDYVWYQYRWQRLAARMFDAEGEGGLVRLGRAVQRRR